jgi:hypothetical protein
MISQSISLALLPLVAALAFAASPAQQKGEDAFLTGPPFSFNEIMQRIGIIADKRLGAAIERRGIGFSPSASDLERFKQAGAGADLIRIIQQKAPPKPKPAAPPPPPPPRTGRLVFHCFPAECDVMVNGKSHGSTVRGAIELRDVPVGDAVIDLRKDGFEGQQVIVPVHAGPPAAHEVTLVPTVTTRARVGQALLEKMFDKFGGREAFRQSALLTASGSATLFLKDGQRSQWQASARLRLPLLALIELTGAKVKWWTSISGNDSKAGGARQLAGGPVAIEMEKLVRLYRDYQPFVLVGRLNGLTVQAIDIVPQQSGESRLRVFNRDAGFRLTLDSEFALIHVVYESPSGLGSGLEVTYADYTSIQKAWFPKSMIIKFADQQQHGLELHFSEVAFVDRIPDKEFHR